MRGKPKERWCRAAVGIGVWLSFWVALVHMPPELTLFDELHVLWQATSYTPWEVARNLMRDSHPPLYYWLIQGWWAIGGFDRPWAYRVFSVLLGLPALPLAFRIGRRLGGEAAGLAAVILMAIHPFYLFQLMLIRMYGLGIALGAWLTDLWLGLMERPSARRWGLWLLAQGLLLFTHYYGAFLILTQWGLLLLRRPPGWRRALGVSGILFGVFGLWLAQAYGGSMENTVRNLSAIPVRPLPWEVIGHAWANLVVGPLADGDFARGAATAMALLVGSAGIARRGLRWDPRWIGVGLMALGPLAAGALIALRWPFFAARYFSMSFVPAVVFLAVFALRGRAILVAALLIPQLLGLSGFSLLHGLPLGLGGGKLHSELSSFDIQDPVLVQAPWHLSMRRDASSELHRWDIPPERDQVVRTAPALWFVGVSLYRGLWEGWLQGMRATHDIDFQAVLEHPIPEYGASIFHLVRKTMPARWRDFGVMWTNGLRLEGVGVLEGAVAPGASIPLVMRWTSDGHERRRWTLFVHLMDAAGHLWLNRDEEPDPPTDQWEPGKVYTVWRNLLVRDVPPGRYRLVVGWYATGTPGYPRVPLQGGAGEVIEVGQVEVGASVEPPRLGLRRWNGITVLPPRVVVDRESGFYQIEVQFHWRSTVPVSPQDWAVVLRDREGRVFAFQRARERPDVPFAASGWILEIWRSPSIQVEGTGGLGWVGVEYQGHSLFRRPVWLFPPTVRWSYDWLFLNRWKP